ncbi:putative polycomb group protein EMBRYONIC FLOWER 2-like [Capsicum annuum]|nr:putative polycomb group protein EMBRYONIC FLOWER 2-like [Capsicum annuum]
MEQKLKGGKTLSLPLGYYASNPEYEKNLPWAEILQLLQSPEMVVQFAEKVYGDKYHTFSNAMIEYMEEMNKLGMIIMEMLAHGLGLADDFFSKNFEEKEATIFRISRYPPCPLPEKIVGIGIHSNPQTLTILCQDQVGGLQVLRDDKQWIRVRPLPNSFVINIGDTLEGTEKIPLSQNAPFFANSDPEMPAVPVPAAQVHNWLLENIAAALTRITERASAKENGPTSAPDQDVPMADVSASSVKSSPSPRGPSSIEGISKSSYVRLPNDIKGSSVKLLVTNTNSHKSEASKAYKIRSFRKILEKDDNPNLDNYFYWFHTAFHAFHDNSAFDIVATAAMIEE